MTETEAKHILVDRFKVVIPYKSGSYAIEEALIPITQKLNSTSIKVDKEVYDSIMADRKREFEEGLEALRKEISNPGFRPNASADCVRLFVEDMGLQPFRVNTKSGQPSIDAETLIAWSNEGVELAGRVLDMRSKRSNLSQLEAWGEYANAGSVQTSWDSLGQPHGRYSSKDPNLQSRVVDIRRTVVASEGWSFISLDLGQAEMVTWASLSADPTFKQVLESGEDFYEWMTKRILEDNPSLDLRGRTPRQVGKTVTLALLYMMKEFPLSKRLGVDIEVARELMKSYSKRIQTAMSYIEGVLKESSKSGVVATKFGRVRMIPGIKTAKGPALHAERKTAWHHHNAGTAAEYLKMKQVKTYRRLISKLGEENAKMVMQMHDEVIWEVREEYVERAKDIALAAFNEQEDGFLRFNVDCRVGKTWGEISK